MLRAGPGCGGRGGVGAAPDRAAHPSPVPARGGPGTAGLQGPPVSSPCPAGLPFPGASLTVDGVSWVGFLKCAFS